MASRSDKRRVRSGIRNVEQAWMCLRRPRASSQEFDEGGDPKIVHSGGGIALICRALPRTNGDEPIKASILKLSVERRGQLDSSIKRALSHNDSDHRLFRKRT